MKPEQIRNPIKKLKPGLQTLDLEDFLPKDTDILSFDLKPFLFKELLLKENDFRESLEHLDWNVYTHKYVRIYCSNNAIIPQWAWLLVSSYLTLVNAVPVYANSLEEAYGFLILQYIESTDWSVYQDQRVVVKGCGDKKLPLQAYVLLTQRLTLYAKSIQYGEPCSTVPIFKKVNEPLSAHDQES